MFIPGLCWRFLRTNHLFHIGLLLRVQVNQLHFNHPVIQQFFDSNPETPSSWVKHPWAPSKNWGSFGGWLVGFSHDFSTHPANELRGSGFGTDAARDVAQLCCCLLSWQGSHCTTHRWGQICGAFVAGESVGPGRLPIPSWGLPPLLRETPRKKDCGGIIFVQAIYI